MSELSILTIVVSLAVCSILAVALYQYVNQRLSLAEHSQKEQAMILHQYIEESSYDIHCLKQQLVHTHKMGLGVSNQSQPQEVYYQQYYQDNENTATEVNEVQHKCVHIDTVMYDAVMNNNTGKHSGSPRMNLNHRLIPVSSDSENTTTDDDDTDSDSDSDSDSGSENSSESDSGTACDNDTIKIIELSQEVTISKKNDTKAQESESESGSSESESESDGNSGSDSDSGSGSGSESESESESGGDSEAETESVVNIVDVVQCNPELTIESDIPLTLDSTSFDLAIESIAVEQLSADIVDLISTLTITEVGEMAADTVAAPESLPEQASSDVTTSKQPVVDAVTATQSQFAGMSVGDLRQFIKDKCKQNPEKTAEIGDIQKMKKAALVQLAEQLH